MVVLKDFLKILGSDTDHEFMRMSNRFQYGSLICLSCCDDFYDELEPYLDCPLFLVTGNSDCGITVIVDTSEVDI